MKANDMKVKTVKTETQRSKADTELLKRCLDRDGGTRGCRIEMDEVARLIGVDEKAVQPMVQAGQLPGPYPFSGARPYWQAGALLDWIWQLFDGDDDGDEARNLFRQSYLVWCVHEQQKLAAFAASQASVWGDTGLRDRLLELLPRAARPAYGGQ